MSGAKWLASWFATTAVLLALANNDKTEPLASTLAVTIAAASLTVAGPKFFDTLNRSFPQ